MGIDLLPNGLIAELAGHCQPDKVEVVGLNGIS